MRSKALVLQVRQKLLLIIVVGLIALVASPLAAEPVVWSWEQELEPLDILEYVEDLPYDEWIEINEVTCRRLFEDIVQRALEQMELEPGEGGAFERLIREKLLYFTPEFEFYYPPYAEVLEARLPRFYITLLHKRGTLFTDNLADMVYIRLGRSKDDQRLYRITFIRSDTDSLLIGVDSYFDRYLPGILEPAKKVNLFLAWQFPDFSEAHLYRDIYNPDWTEYNWSNEPELVFRIGSPYPHTDRTEGDARLEISGVQRLFEPGRLEHYYENWEPYDGGYFQAIRGIINLCKLQLDLISNGQALEMVLRRDFLEYTPWDPIDEETFDPESEPSLELVSVRRETTEDPENIVIYQFDIGREFGRVVYVRFDRGWGGIGDYEWGVKQISFVQPIIIECIDANGEELRGFGDLTRVFKFELDASGRLIADYYEEYLSPGGWPLTLTEDGFVITPDKPLEPKGYFREGDPEMHWYGE